MLWIILTAIACFLIYWFYVKPLSYWRKKGVKQGKPWIFCGDISRVIFRLNNMQEMLLQLYRNFPNVRYFGLYLLSKPYFVVKDPELVKQIAVKNFDHFPDHVEVIDAETDPLWAKNLISLRGQAWRDMRSTLSPSFTSSKMRYMFTIFDEAAKNFVQYFISKDQDNIELDVKDAYNRYANDVIASAAFGISVDSLSKPNNEFFVMGREVTNFSGFWKAMRMLAYNIMPKVFKFFKVSLFEKGPASFFSSLIKETIRTRQDKGIVRPDMINLLLEARKGILREEDKTNIDTGFATAEESEIGKVKKGRPTITDDDISAQALIFFVAGFDTVTSVCCFVTYELAVNQDVQEKLRDEIRKTWEECNGKITYEALLNMKYMDMVMSEALRKWPPAVSTDRDCVKPFVIEPTTPEETPVRLNKGDIVLIPIYGIHMDPNYYPSPDRFDPERFSDENKDQIKPYTYIPFGVGPRNCIGSRFALLEIKVLLFHLLSKFRVTPSKKLKIPLRLATNSVNVNAEGGFWFELHRL